ncbi:hypothetical protein [Endozoicomonas sp. 4G]|uniref:hypothetical protein n=1 Tax=Endozoicomonas sp. 4G TaxID=2872754 RepID=UPI002078B7A2|nr:hypothetical protein [Endozoicomonas sp. 4G]
MSKQKARINPLSGFFKPLLQVFFLLYLSFGLKVSAAELYEETEAVSVTPDTSLPYNSFVRETGWVEQIWGRPFRDRLYLGMWTLHLECGDDQESNNQLIGLSYKGYYGGTFVNTHSNRVWSGGVQRTLFQQKYGEFDIEAGYRAGIMYGYKEYLSRVFPLVQGLLDIDYKGFGIEFSYAAVVFTAGFYYRF